MIKKIQVTLFGLCVGFWFRFIFWFRVWSNLVWIVFCVIFVLLVLLIEHLEVSLKVIPWVGLDSYIFVVIFGGFRPGSLIGKKLGNFSWIRDFTKIIPFLSWNSGPNTPPPKFSTSNWCPQDCPEFFWIFCK